MVKSNVVPLNHQSSTSDLRPQSSTPKPQPSNPAPPTSSSTPPRTDWSWTAGLYGRSARDCSNRWNRLNGKKKVPKPKTEKKVPRARTVWWTAAEDELLIQKQAILGHHWVLIAPGLPGRSARDCRKRWNRLNKKGPTVGQKTNRSSQPAPTPVPRKSAAKKTPAPRTVKSVVAPLV